MATASPVYTFSSTGLLKLLTKGFDEVLVALHEPSATPYIADPRTGSVIAIPTSTSHAPRPQNRASWSSLQGSQPGAIPQKTDFIVATYANPGEGLVATGRAVIVTVHEDVLSQADGLR